MTTPEQMRALADDGDDRADYTDTRTPIMVRQLTAALRAAADEMDRLRDVDEYNQQLSRAAVTACKEVLDKAWAENAELRDELDRLRAYKAYNEHSAEWWEQQVNRLQNIVDTLNTTYDVEAMVRAIKAGE